MNIENVFVPFKTLLAIGWFLILCVIAPTLAAIILLGGTGYAIYTAASEKKQGEKMKEK